MEKQLIEKQRELIRDFAAWSIKYPRDRIYPMSKLHMDDELIALEERAKQLESEIAELEQQPKAALTAGNDPINYSIPYISTNGEFIIGEIVRICDEFVSFENKCIAVRQKLEEYKSQFE